MIKSALQSSLTNDVKYRSMSAGAVPSSEYLIQTITVGSTPVPAVEFLNLNQHAGIYRHLQIVGVTRSTNSGTFSFMKMELNGDTASNYNRHLVFGEGGGIGAYGYPNVQDIGFGYGAGGGSPAGSFGLIVCDILDAFNTNKFKTARSMFSSPNGYNMIGINSGAWRNTNVVSSIKIVSQTDNFAEFSRFSLYGVTA